MLTRNAQKDRDQMRMVTLDDLVEPLYCEDNGRPCIDPVMRFSAFSKNYTRRFRGTDLFERIFRHILAKCVSAEMADPGVVFVDSTHVKARANSKKSTRTKNLKKRRGGMGRL